MSATTQVIVLITLIVCYVVGRMVHRYQAEAQETNEVVWSNRIKLDALVTLHLLEKAGPGEDEYAFAMNAINEPDFPAVRHYQHMRVVRGARPKDT